MFVYFLQTVQDKFYSKEDFCMSEDYRIYILKIKDTPPHTLSKRGYGHKVPGWSQGTQKGLWHGAAVTVPTDFALEFGWGHSESLYPKYTITQFTSLSGGELHSRSLVIVPPDDIFKESKILTK